MIYKPVLKEQYDALNFYLKKTGKEIPCKSLKGRTQDFINKYAEVMYNNYPYDETMNERRNFMISIFELDMFVHDLNKQLPHMFIENPMLVKYLSEMDVKDVSIATSSIQKRDADISTTNPQEGKISNESILFTDEKENLAVFYQAIHTDDKSYLIGTYRRQDSGDPEIFILDDEKNYTITTLNNEENNLNFIAKKENKALRLAINYMAYLEAFPECIKEGVPDKTSKKNAKHGGNFKKLEISQAIIEKNQGSLKTPHFRKGCFKRLSAERYTKKKDQIIFCRATMVKGRAKTMKEEEKSLSIF